MTREPRLVRQAKVPLADIETKHRLRPVSEAGVESLIASISDLKVMKDAIHVRQVRGGQLVLIAGAHRVEAAKRLGWSEVEAKVWTDVTDDWARLMEVDDNLAGAEMNALDTAVFLAARKAVYEKLHPEAAAGTFRGNQHTGKLAAEIISFARSTAEKFGLDERHIRNFVSAGQALTSELADQWRTAPKAPGIVDLIAFSKIVDPEERIAVVTRLASGTAKKVADACRQITEAKGGPKSVVKAPVEDELQALLKAWSRASAVARRRFVYAEFEELERLVVVEGKVRSAPVPVVQQEAAE